MDTYSENPCFRVRRQHYISMSNLAERRPLFQRGTSFMKKRTIFSLLASITCFVSKPVTAFTVPSLYSRTFHSSSIKLKSSKYDSQYENNKPNNPTFEDFDVTDDITSSSPLGRRAAVSGTVKWARASVLGLFLNGACSEDVRAFPNKISNQYDDRPKRRGPQVNIFVFIIFRLYPPIGKLSLRSITKLMFALLHS